jgi:hypothetical protein
LLRRCASRNDGPLAVIASRAKQSRYRERAVRMPAFWPTRSPTGEVAKVGFGSIVAVWERRGERRLLAGTEEKIHLSRQIVSLLWQSRPSRARPRAPPLARTCRSAMSPIGVRRGKADAEQTVLNSRPVRRPHGTRAHQPERRWGPPDRYRALSGLAVGCAGLMTGYVHRGESRIAQLSR